MKRHWLGWQPEKNAIYVTVVPPGNDSKTIYRLTARNMPAHRVCSVSVYNAKGYFEKNPYDAHPINNITAKKADGSVNGSVRPLR